MRRNPTERIAELRRAVDCMPLHTRVAMLEGIRTHSIIAGAYTDRDGGVCPMLAAHRCGGRTDYATFARAWDRFTGVVRRRSRRATVRELRILETHIEASLLGEEQVDLSAAIAEHRALRRSPDLSALELHMPVSDIDRTPELRRRGGWAWLRPFRRLDDYERALDRVQADELLLDVERAAPRPAGDGERSADERTTHSLV